MTYYEVTDETYQQFTMDVRGQVMDVTLYFVLDNDAWYADIRTSAGEVVALGERMVSGIDTGTKFGIPGVYIAGPNGEAKDPDSTGWADLFFYVLDEDELAADTGLTKATPTYLIDGFSNPLVDKHGLYLVVE